MRVGVTVGSGPGEGDMPEGYRDGRIGKRMADVKRVVYEVRGQGQQGTGGVYERAQEASTVAYSRVVEGRVC